MIFDVVHRLVTGSILKGSGQRGHPIKVWVAGDFGCEVFLD